MNVKIKYLSVLPIISVLILSGVSSAHAQVFTGNLYFGLQNNIQVSQLQDFLASQGLYKGPISGNFYFLTLNAVKAFQTQQGITPAAGYFGPLTMAAANKIAGVEVSASNAQATTEIGSTPPTSNTIQLQLDALLKQLALLQSQLTTQQIQQNTTPVTTTSTPTSTPTTLTIDKVNKRAVVIVYKNVYDVLKPEMDNFQNDVFTNLGIKIDIIQLQDSLSYTPLDIRNLLIKECKLDGVNGCSNLEGAVFVGDIPYALYEQVYDSNHLAPFMYFYEDLDASFKQNNLGHYYGYDSYGAHEGPEIYTGWIRSTFPSTDFNNYINELRAYFQKHHNFFTKQSIPSNLAVSAIQSPDNNHAFSIPSLGLTVYGTANSIEITPDITNNLAPFKPALLAELSKGPEVAYLHSDGSATEVWGLTASDFSSLTNLPLFMLTWGCQNGDFIENIKDSIALAFINGKNLGLSFLGKLDSSDIDVYSGNCPNCGFFVNNQVNFFKYYNKGEYVGEAWLNVEHDFADFKDPSGQLVGDLYKLSGPLQRIIIGSPFIYSPTARK